MDSVSCTTSSLVAHGLPRLTEENSNKFYEFFKATHFFFAIVFLIFFFIHCAYALSSWDYFIAGLSLYAVCLLFAFVKTFFRHGVSHAAQIRLETPHSLRVAVPTKSTWRPGQHVFLRFIACGAHSLTAHPLTICSLPSRDQSASRGGEMVFYVQPRGGITGRLAAMAHKQPNQSVTVFLEGPYGGMPKRWSKGFDHTLLVAGGSGCGLTLALIESWLRAESGTERHLEVVLATRDPEMRIWYMEELERLAERQYIQGKTELPGVTVAFCETHNESLVGSSSPDPGSSTDEEKKTVVKNVRYADGGSSTIATLFGVRFSHGRPDAKSAVERLASKEGATVGVAVCGPSGMVHDVAAAAADAQVRILQARPGAAELYLHREAFS